MFRYVPTICPYCATGCGLNLVVQDGRVVDTAPWHRSPVNEGKLCPKGAQAHEFINHPDRLTTPLIRKNGALVPSSWDEAYSLIAEKFRAFGPGEVACLASSRTSNEDTYAFQKFARVVLATPHIDNCARLCHSSSVTGLSMVFGSGAMTNSLDDLEKSASIFVIGSNTVEAHPLINRRIILAQQRGARLIVADPRRTPLVCRADLHLPLLPGTDVMLLSSMMQYIISHRLADETFIAERTTGFESVRSVVMQDTYSLENASRVCGVPVEPIARAAELVATSPSCALLFAMGITQHAVGVDNVRSCANLQMLTGNIGNSGGGVNPLRGQNNVQGACDMGCLPDFYPGYRPVSDPVAVAAMTGLWGMEPPGKEPGLMLSEIFAALKRGEQPVRALYIMGEDPLLADPASTRLPEALRHLEFLVVQDIFLTGTGALADVVLPAACFAEDEGSQTSAERRVQRLRKAQDPPGTAKPDWKIMTELAARLGYAKQFPYTSAEDVFSEIARVVPQYAGMSYSRLDRPEGVQWPCPAPDHPGTPILHTARFNTPDGKGVFTPIPYVPPREVPDADYPFFLDNGRSIWHWHWGSMTHRSPALEGELSSAWLEIHPDDAGTVGLLPGDIARISSRRGSVEVPVRISSSVRPGVVFLPLHFKEAPVNVLTSEALDPICAIPEYKAVAVKIERVVPPDPV